MARRCMISTISSAKAFPVCKSALLVLSHGFATTSHGVDGGVCVFKQFSCDPIAPHKLFMASNEMAIRCGILKSHIMPEPDRANSLSISCGCHEILLIVMFRGAALSFFWNGDTMRLIEWVTTSVTDSLGDEQWKSNKCTNGESRWRVASVELRVGHQLMSLTFFSVCATEIGFSIRRMSHKVIELSTKPANKRPFDAIDSPCSARVLQTLTVGELWRKSIIFMYLWLIPANKMRPVLSQHSECAVSDKPIKCKMDFSFGTPRSVSHTVIQWSERFLSCPMANRFDSVSWNDKHTQGLDCLGAVTKM